MARRARRADGQLTEDAFQGQVLGLAGFYGWLAYHTRDSRGSQRGFPDLTLVRAPEVVFAELKGEKAARRASAAAVAQRPGWLQRADVTDDQAAWLEQLMAVSIAVASRVAGGAATTAPPPAVDVYVWQPSDWPQIEERLARHRVLQPTPPPT